MLQTSSEFSINIFVFCTIWRQIKSTSQKVREIELLHNGINKKKMISFSFFAVFLYSSRVSLLFHFTLLDLSTHETFFVIFDRILCKTLPFTSGNQATHISLSLIQFRCLSLTWNEKIMSVSHIRKFMGIPLRKIKLTPFVFLLRAHCTGRNSKISI